ncbi:hypothetical protein DPMN_118158 [Dreissena polymorpha]|uniref:Uncharacterized protein n=1 Tax=Dreissena polymorpha TaxID=45954 RepID=A0A9D4GGD9_DREPO|nr:hypothetical protein DPMN_118158 [Dreissena polymorpha]
MNLLTKFHEDRTINVASRVLTRFYYSHIRKNAPPLDSHFFQENVTIFELIQDIIKTNRLTKFHEDWTINVASRVLTMKKCPAPWQPYFSSKYIIVTNLLIKFHEDWTINVASRVLTILFTCFHYLHIEKTAPTPGGHVFPPIMTIFKLVRDIYKIYV